MQYILSGMRSFSKAAAFVTVFVMVSAGTANAQAGSLDVSFGINGLVTTPFLNGGSNGNTVTLQDDGKIVVAGASNSDVAVARYNSDGSLDNSFGTGGQVTTTIGTMNNMAYKILVQSDGKIVIAGTAEPGASDFDFLLIRYNTDGTLDNAFGPGGIVETSFNTLNDVAYSCVLQSDGKIISAGTADVQFAMSRHNTDGTLDSTFGTNGLVTSPVGFNGGLGRAVAIQSDGKLVMTGICFDSSFVKGFGLARYTSDGISDSTFGIDGVAASYFTGNNDYAQSMAIQSDGKIVVAGFDDAGAKFFFAAERYNNDGSLDTSFGIGGKVTTPVGTYNDYGRSVAIQSDGKILVGGYTGDDISYDYVLVRYNSDGSLDPVFGNGGKVITDFGGSSEGLCVTLQSDEKIVVSGTHEGNFALARYNNDVVGIHEITTSSLLNIFPNPVSFAFTISLNNQSSVINSQLTIFDVTGRVVQEQKINSQPYTVNCQLSSGVYFVKVRVGQKMYSGKLLVE